LTANKWQSHSHVTEWNDTTYNLFAFIFSVLSNGADTSFSFVQISIVIASLYLQRCSYRPSTIVWPTRSKRQRSGEVAMKSGHICREACAMRPCVVILLLSNLKDGFHLSIIPCLQKWVCERKRKSSLRMSENRISQLGLMKYDALYRWNVAYCVPGCSWQGGLEGGESLLVRPPPCSQCCLYHLPINIRHSDIIP